MAKRMRMSWAIATGAIAAMVLLIVLLNWMRDDLFKPGPIAGKAASFTMRPPIEPRSAATWMTDPADATELYRQAISAYEADPQVFERYLERGRLDSPEYARVAPAMQLLLNARIHAKASVFAADPQRVITYENDKPILRQAARTLGQVGKKVGRQHQQAGQVDQARAIYQAVYALGVQMYEERLVFDEWYEAREMLAVARWLAELDEQSANTLRQVDGQFAAFFESQMRPVQQAIFVMNPHLGDLLALARNGGDLMWRTEAILAMGRARTSFEATADDDQMSSAKRNAARRAAGAIQQKLEQIRADRDPRIALAAEKAMSLTVPEFRKLR